MAKTRGPLLSVEARGKFGNNILFQTGKGQSVARAMFTPKNRKTAVQQNNRNNITFGVSIWQTLSSYTKLIWEFVKDKKQLSMSGYNYFLSEYNISRNTGQPTKLYPDMNLFENYPIPNGIVSWWKFDEQVGNTANDSIGGNVGTIYGATHVDGIINKALYFDGINNYVRVENNNTLCFGASTDFSIMAWFKTTSLNNTRIVSKQESGPDYPNYMLGTNLGHVSIQITQNITYTKYLESPLTYNDGNWHFVSATFKRSGNVIIYIGGDQVASANISTIGDIDNPQPLFIGCDRANYWFFPGIIDEVMIYNRALNQAEITHNYNRR